MNDSWHYLEQQIKITQVLATFTVVYVLVKLRTCICFDFSVGKDLLPSCKSHWLSLSMEAMAHFLRSLQPCAPRYLDCPSLMNTEKSVMDIFATWLPVGLAVINRPAFHSGPFLAVPIFPESYISARILKNSIAQTPIQDLMKH